jgi:hypothetical protein
LRKFKRDEVPLLKNSSPFPFLRGRGIQGDGVLSKLKDVDDKYSNSFSLSLLFFNR